jgi:hypothetical protein
MAMVSNDLKPKVDPNFSLTVLGGRYDLLAHGNKIFFKLAQPLLRKTFLRVL